MTDLTIKLVELPDIRTEPGRTAAQGILIPFAELISMYIEETKAGRVFNMETFISQWSMGEVLVAGYYDKDVLVGYAVGQLMQARFEKGYHLIIETLYIKPEYRNGTDSIGLGLAAIDTLKQRDDILRTIIHAEPDLAEMLLRKGKPVYVGVEV